MSRICSVEGCDKKPRVGNHVSHAKNRVKRWLYPNVNTIRYSYSKGGSSEVYRGGVCMKCIKAGIVKKVL